MACVHPECAGFCPSCIAETAQGGVPLKSPDADIVDLLENLALDVEINVDLDCTDGEMSAIAHRMEITARRLVREAGYFLPGTVWGR